jgi:hydroxyethylthiazole kinase-like uncharacterized protein yjeF
MKIFSAAQIKEADRQTVSKQGISSDELMERAGKLVFEEIHKRLEGSGAPIKIFCGIGNNGGDGLVIGRHLIEHLYDVTIYVVNYSDKRSNDFLKSYDKVKNATKNWPILLKSEDDFPEIKKEDFVIDAVFGIGLNRPLVDWVANLIRHINHSEAFVLAIDMPSGLFADQPTKAKDAVIQANFTLTFQAPKLVFYLPDTGKFAGDLQVLDIGLDRDYLIETPTSAHLIRKQEAKTMYVPREEFTHKGTYGHALLVGGSYGKMGSISLTATAAMRTGAGMATVFVPKCGYQIMQTLLPEAMVITDKAENYLSSIDFDLDPSVIGFGVGVGQNDETLKAFEALLDKTEKPMVIDADGLNLLAANKHLLKKLPKDSVLTPHPKELERLMGSWEDDFEKLEMARTFVREHKVVLLIKGSRTITVTEEDIYINSTGNPGMATAGSGDVLTGVITGLISQGYDPLTAAVFGVYLHGKAGDIAVNQHSYQGLIAGDIAQHIGAAYLDLFSTPKA